MKKGFTLLITLFVLILTLSSCTPEPNYETDDNVCVVDSDCVMALVECSCDCGVPINKIHSQKYLDIKEEKCEFYTGRMCKMDCNQELKCVNNICTIINE